jgi:16S rRNA (uracil1498-N3)-methyltransferase
VLLPKVVRMITNFYTRPENIDKDALTIEGEEARHILQVLRYKAGDLIDVVDGCGNKFRVNITYTERNRLEGKILLQVRKENEPITNLTLAQSICKGMKMDWIVEKCVEVGVNNIVPLLTERSEAHFKNPLQEKSKTERWERVAISAMKQSLRCFLPKVSPVTKLEDLLKNIKRYDLALMASPENKSKKLEDLAELKSRPRNILLLVGPEAGFSPDELKEAKEKGVISITLGSRRFRTETAAVLFSSLVLYELKDLT